MLRILSFSTNPDILPVMDRLVNKHDESWKGVRAGNLAEASRELRERDIDIVLLGAGTGHAEHEHLANLATELGKTVRFVHHYGGGSGLLFAEIRQAMEREPV